MKKFVVFITVFLPYFVEAQIIDDSTKQIYGLFSVRFFKKEKIALNDTNFVSPDSSISTFNAISKNEAQYWQYQDLGNWGTASMPLFHQLSATITTQIGYSAFDLYKTHPDSIKYYRTYSPYTSLKYTQNNRGLALFQFIHSQNISPRLNITLDVDRLASSKQIGAGSYRERRLVDGWKTTLSSNYYSKNKKYNFLANFNHFNFKQIEQGGIDYPYMLDNLKMDSVKYFSGRIADAVSREFNNSLEVYHQKNIGKGFDLYQQANYSWNKYVFLDGNTVENLETGVYPQANKYTDTINVLYRHSVVQHLLGIRGYYKGFLSNLYARQQLVGIKKDAVALTTSIFDFIIGGNSQIKVKNWGLLVAQVELNPIEGNLLIDGKLKVSSLTVHYTFLREPIEIFKRIYESQIYNWNIATLNKPISNQLRVDYGLVYKRLKVTPAINYQLLDNYIYYDATSAISQTSAPFSNIRFEVFSKLNLKNWYFENFTQYAQTSNAAIYRFPEFSTYFNVNYQFVYAKVLPLTIGLDVYYKTKYLANAYNPALQQFYLQDKTYIWGKPVANVYTKLMINKVKLGVIYNFANQFISKNYYTTPFYPGMRSSFVIKADWPLFD